MGERVEMANKGFEGQLAMKRPCPTCIFLFLAYLVTANRCLNASHAGNNGCEISFYCKVTHLSHLQ